jgi:predicted Holliday junction resolvase-like endonuclease
VEFVVIIVLLLILSKSMLKKSELQRELETTNEQINFDIKRKIHPGRIGFTP